MSGVEVSLLQGTKLVDEEWTTLSKIVVGFAPKRVL
jgi:hypothetical protein